MALYKKGNFHTQADLRADLKRFNFKGLRGKTPCGISGQNAAGLGEKFSLFSANGFLSV
jgi:hypothetical protein